MTYQDLKYLSGVASVIITTHNDSKYIGDCIKSLVENTLIPLEIILCDNSTIPETWQRTKDIAEQAAEKAFDLKIIHSRNQTSVGHVNNYGFQISRGEFLFAANDDIKIYSSSWCERMIKAAEQKPDGGVFGVVGTSTYRAQNVPAKYNANEYIGLIKESPTVAGLLIHIPRKILNTIGLWDENLADYCWLDVDWCIRTRAQGLKPYICHDVFVHHLRIATQTMRQEQQAKFCAKYGVSRIKNESDLLACIPKAKALYATV